MKFLKSKERKKLVEELNGIYGITEADYQMIVAGKQRIRAFSGSLTKDEINKLAELVNVEVVGMYLISTKDSDARISFDALPLFKDQVTKKIVEISKEQLDYWIRGYDLDIANIPRGIVVIMFDGELVGIGKSNEEKIFNYVPKERKLKTQLPSTKN